MHYNVNLALIITVSESEGNDESVMWKKLGRV
jgi:hypothetical protein